MKEKFINSKWHFTMVENSVIEDERLLPSEKLVYVVLLNLPLRSGLVFLLFLPSLNFQDILKAQ